MTYTTLHGKLIKVRRTTRCKYANGRGHRVKSTNVAEIVNGAEAEKNRAALKGKQNGNCNVTACQRPGATWWNTSTRAYYCANCASEINRWSKHDEGFSICYPSEAAAIAAGAMFT